MTRIYDNWDRLVRATLRREELRSVSQIPSDLSSTEFPPSSLENFLSLLQPTPSFDLSKFLLGRKSFTYLQIVEATESLSNSNLIKQGHSGDLFYGVLGGIKVVIKRIELSPRKSESHRYVSELEFLHKVSHSGLVNLLGHCSENMYVKFLVYEYMPKKDLSSYLNRKFVQDSGCGGGDHLRLSPLDWTTRLKIAIGVAKGLCYLHYECNPPYAHRDVQPSSILLDENFEAKLGSFSDICPALEKVAEGNMIARFFWLTNGTGDIIKGEATAACAYDVYCFGKLLLQLVTGRLRLDTAGTSDIPDPNSPAQLAANNWKDLMLQIYDENLLRNILDPALTVQEDVFKEVWAVSVVALVCLNPKPSKRPKMAQVVKALKTRKISQNTHHEMMRTIEAQKTFLGPISPKFFK